MKRILTRLIPAVAFFLFLCGPAQGQTQVRIATVDLSQLFTNYWKTKQADMSLQEMKSEITRSGKEMVENWQKGKEAYQKLLADANNQAVSSEERERRKKEAEAKLLEIKKQETDIQQFEQQARTRLSEQTMRMRENLLVEIRAAVNSKAKAGGHTLVFDSAGQTSDRTPFLLYSSGEDLTASVLAQLNAAAPVEPAAEKKTPAKR